MKHTLILTALLLAPLTVGMRMTANTARIP